MGYCKASSISPNAKFVLFDAIMNSDIISAGKLIFFCPITPLAFNRESRFESVLMALFITLITLIIIKNISLILCCSVYDCSFCNIPNGLRRFLCSKRALSRYGTRLCFVNQKFEIRMVFVIWDKTKLIPPNHVFLAAYVSFSVMKFAITFKSTADMINRLLSFVIKKVNPSFPFCSKGWK